MSNFDTNLALAAVSLINSWLIRGCRSSLVILFRALRSVINLGSFGLPGFGIAHIEQVALASASSHIPAASQRFICCRYAFMNRSGVLMFSIVKLVSMFVINSTL